MTPEGFYRVVWDGNPGVGCCHRYTSAVREETYENWDLMIIRGIPGDLNHVATVHVNSTSDSFKRLVIGKPIKGLPAKFKR